MKVDCFALGNDETFLHLKKEIEKTPRREARSRTHRRREIHGGGYQDIAGRDLEAVNGAWDCRHFGW